MITNISDSRIDDIDFKEQGRHAVFVKGVDEVFHVSISADGEIDPPIDTENVSQSGEIDTTDFSIEAWEFIEWQDAGGERP